MNTSLPFIVLLGAVAAAPVLAGDLTAPRLADAQSQAATLLRAEVISTATGHSRTDGRRIDKDVLRVSAQAQAAQLLTADTLFAPASARQPAADGARHRRLEARLSPDAQAQAQGILRSESPRSPQAAVQVVAASR